MQKYVAFLRGINVGGKNVISMNALKTLIESLGFTQVKTILTSGNILFTTEKTRSQTLEILTKSLSKTLVILRTAEDMTSIVHSDPFKNIPAAEASKFYVTFFEEGLQKEQYKALNPSVENTSNWMKSIDKEFGKNNTTRSWNTILKIFHAL
jgi:uncharacterized protein (DUF1697 family)